MLSALKFSCLFLFSGTRKIVRKYGIAFRTLRRALMSVLFDEDPEERRQADDFVEREDSSRDGDPAVSNGVHNPLSDHSYLERDLRDDIRNVVADPRPIDGFVAGKRKRAARGLWATASAIYRGVDDPGDYNSDLDPDE